MQAELRDLRGEIPRCIPEEYRENCLRMILNQKRLFEGGASWQNWTPSFTDHLHGTWIATAVSSIVEQGGNEWMLSQADAENEYGSLCCYSNLILKGHDYCAVLT